MVSTLIQRVNRALIFAKQLNLNCRQKGVLHNYKKLVDAEIVDKSQLARKQRSYNYKLFKVVDSNRKEV